MSAYDWHPQQQQQQQFVVAETHLHEAKGAAGKRSRQTYSKYQTAVLETVFQTSRYIVRNKRQQMSAELSLTERQIKIWFQNRRMKEKKCHKEAPRIVVDRHVPRLQGEVCPAAAALAVGYAEDYNNAVEPADDPRDDDVFVSGYHPAVSKHRSDDVGGGDYAVYGGYDLLTASDPYDQRMTKQQCWSAPVDFHQDLYGDHDNSSHFQRLPTTHHHYPLNTQVQDYCPPQLQAAHGY